MAELKDLLPLSKNLSLLYIDEDEEFLSSIVKVLQKVFKSVDDAQNATIALGYLKVNSYDLVIVDTSSAIMSPELLVQNIRKITPYQNIILTSSSDSLEGLRLLIDLQVQDIIKKPYKASLLIEKLYSLVRKIDHERRFLEPKIEQLSSDLLYERKRIGRFMLSEKKFQKTLEEYANSFKMNRSIYELTRLPNKNALQNDLGETTQALLYINIDHFDFINTIYGMGKANKLLKATAQKLKLFLSTNAKLYHITADEFVILIDDPAQQQQMQLAQQIQALFKESAVEFDEHDHFVVFSIGVAFGEGRRLFVNAKAASKEARYYGGNSIVVYNPNSQYMKEQKRNLYWIEVLKKAVEEDRLINYYQLSQSNRAEGIKHYEVLCRLIDENGQLVDAKEFIQSAKLVGLASQITKVVIDKAFKLFANNEYSFSINITLYDLHEGFLSDFLKYKCNRYSVNPSRVHLEIAEDILAANHELVDAELLKLKSEGYMVIVDDFSNERSSIMRLLQLKAEYIKIDGALIEELQENETYQSIVRSIVSFAKKSNIKTIAKNVESSEINELVNSLGVDYSQGYFIAKPSITLK